MQTNKYILGLVLLIIFSCDNYDVSPVADESAKPNVSVTTMPPSLISEAGSPTISITIELDRPLKTTTSFTANQISGSASEEDYSVSTAVVPAYQTSTTMDITIHDDTTAEALESLELEILPADTDSEIYEVLGKPVISFSIENSVAFTAQLAWDGNYLDANGGTHSYCDYDLDLELYSSDFNDVLNASYSHCPEDYIIGQGELADGDYWIVPSFWEQYRCYRSGKPNEYSC